MPTQQSYTFASHTSQPTSQSLQKSMPAPRQDKFNFFLPSLRCFNYFATHSRHISSWTETAKTYTGQGLTMTEDRRPACNTGLAKVAVQCSADTFVVNQSLVLRINICGVKRHLRQARNR
jgi:hypothetical protein